MIASIKLKFILKTDFFHCNFCSLKVNSGKEDSGQHIHLSDKQEVTTGGTLMGIKCTLVYFSPRSVVRGSRRVDVHSSTAVAVRCKAIKMD